EETAQVQVLRHVLAQGTKEFLVDRALEWPVVHSVAALVDGAALAGNWVEGGSGEAREEVVDLSPLPCWQHLPEASWRRAVADLVEEVDRRAAVARKVEGKRSLGAAKVLAMKPTSRREEQEPGERSVKRRFHAHRKEVLEQMREAWAQVLAAYREASALLRSGEREVRFPEGTFPPSLPFVPFETGPAPGTPRARGQPA
ncbi:MAG: hypothetical protein MI919_06845, partial [Holophagales bacterium]|nr:hypothetical protein [Holophagales bacterium]